MERNSSLELVHYTNCLKWPGLGHGHGQVPPRVAQIQLSRHHCLLDLKMQAAGARRQGQGSNMGTQVRDARLNICPGIQFLQKIRLI